MGLRIYDSSLTRTTFTEAKTNGGEILVDWAALADTGARPIPITELGNGWWQGAYINTDASYTDKIEADHTYIRVSTDNGTTWFVFNVAALNVDYLVTDGDGSLFLANNGTYQSPSLATDHSAGTNLDYANSGHVGFAPALTSDENYVTDAEKVVVGNTSNTNTGDETLTTIVSKLENASNIPILDVDELFTAEDVEAALAEIKETIDSEPDTVQAQQITLPAASTVQGRINSAVEGTDYPTGWVLSTGISDKNLVIEHNLGKSIAAVSVFQYTNSTDKQLKIGSAAYTGLYDYNETSIEIQSLCTSNANISIQLIFN